MPETPLEKTTSQDDLPTPLDKTTSRVSRRVTRSSQNHGDYGAPKKAFSLAKVQTKEVDDIENSSEGTPEVPPEETAEVVKNAEDIAALVRSSSSHIMAVLIQSRSSRQKTILSYRC
jgi:hypothetical protein